MYPIDFFQSYEIQLFPCYPNNKGHSMNEKLSYQTILKIIKK